VLVFLPGAAAIRRAQVECAALAADEGLLVLPLHGELPAEEQDRAVRPAERRKLILATNVAETSVTIEGVVAVVDSGLARVAGHSPWSGLPRLQVARVSRASAVQRSGRAGRTREGRCLRLYTAQDFNARPPNETPEVRRLDLAETVLELRAAGVRALKEFDWFEAPSADALEAAEELLRRLGALDGPGALTDVGRRMLRLPVHPRLARVVAEAESRGVGRAACVAAALIGERDIRAGRVSLGEGARPPEPRAASTHGDSDLLELLDLFAEAGRAGFAPERVRRMGLDPAAVRAVERVSRQLARTLGGGAREAGPAVQLSREQERELLVSVLAGYPDRVARRRSTGAKAEESELVLSGGGTAVLARESVVRRAEFLVAVDAEERDEAARARGTARAARTAVRLASAVEPEWLLDLFTERIREATEARWNAQAERVEVVRRMVYDQLTLEEWRAEGATGPEVSSVLAEAALAAGPQAFGAGEEVERFLARVEFVARAFPEAALPALGDEDVRAALEAMCEGRRGFAELREAARAGELLERLRQRLTHEQSRLVAQMAPERVTLASGRAPRVRYERGAEPHVASRLQDFFGMSEGPKIAGGRRPLVLHLLAPSQRPVQVTTDLPGFWSRHYPQVRRELSRRYPRHAWPEDPLRK
jgi:ATP-dependent helicase HrpB